MLPIQSNLTTVNLTVRGTNPLWVVLHYTANNGDTAKGNTDYFKSTDRGSSANYFVDENSIWECVKPTDTAWHVGNDWYYNTVRNYNSIGIEMCSRLRPGFSKNDTKGYYLKDETVNNAIDLTKYLMSRFNIPVSRVCRHYDVTGKICPAPMVHNNGTVTWSQFISRLTESEDTLMSAEYDKLNKKIDDNQAAVLKTLEDMRGEYRQKVYNTISEVPEWYRAEVQWCIDNGIIKGVSPTALGLTNDRCAVATMIYRAHNPS